MFKKVQEAYERIGRERRLLDHAAGTLQRKVAPHLQHQRHLFHHRHVGVEAEGFTIAQRVPLPA